MNNAPSQHQGTPPNLRIEKLFFKDIEKSPSVIGRSDYLPLTRRIQRWVLLKELSAETSELTLKKLKRILRKKHHQFNEKAADLNKPGLSIIQLSARIEAFLDNPDIRIPEALKKSVGKPSPQKDKKLVALESLGWKCFYLLSLLPPERRTTYDSVSFDIEISNYFDLVRHEGAASKTKLLEGCMRYVINISRLYIDCGLYHILTLCKKVSPH